MEACYGTQLTVNSKVQPYAPQILTTRYLLERYVSCSGQLVMEIFNREDASLNAATNVTRGVGVFYKKDFDKIKDLFKRVKRKEAELGGEGL